MEPKGNDMAGDELRKRLSSMAAMRFGVSGKSQDEVNDWFNDEARACVDILARLSRSTSTDAVAFAYSFELARIRDADGTYSRFGEPRLSYEAPHVPEGAVRNLTPLYAHPSLQGGAEPWQPGGTVEFTGNGVVYTHPIGETGGAVPADGPEPVAWLRRPTGHVISAAQFKDNSGRWSDLVARDTSDDFVPLYTRPSERGPSHD